MTVLREVALRSMVSMVLAALRLGSSVIVKSVVSFLLSIFSMRQTFLHGSAPLATPGRKSADAVGSSRPDAGGSSRTSRGAAVNVQWELSLSTILTRDVSRLHHYLAVRMLRSIHLMQTFLYPFHRRLSCCPIVDDEMLMVLWYRILLLLPNHKSSRILTTSRIPSQSSQVSCASLTWKVLGRGRPIIVDIGVSLGRISSYSVSADEGQQTLSGRM